MNAENTNILPTTISPKSPTAVLVLCIFLGTLGIHRFYVGKIFTGILMLLTAGGFGIWYLVDLALIISNRFRDSEGRVVELAKNPISFKKIMTIFAVLIVLFYGFFISMVAAVVLSTNALTNVARSQLDALRSNNIDKAYSYTTKDFQNETSLTTFKKFAEQNKLENNEGVVFVDRKIENDKGDIKGILKFKNGSNAEIEYSLKKEDGQWKILEMDVKPIR